jgi:uncharacterized protein YbjT (DUF2867 family)
VDVVIAGGHGQVALRLLRLLSEAGHRGRGLIRDPSQAGDLEAVGGEVVVRDMEREDLVGAAAGADAVVFAAGAGPGSGAERKVTMDRDGAVKLVEAAQSAGVPRYVIVSSVGAESPPADDAVFSVYLRAKAEADQALMASDRDWTVVRPGMLTDDPGTGRVRVQEEPIRAAVPRDDVAAVLAAVVDESRAVAKVLYVVGGDDPIEDALLAVYG